MLVITRAEDQTLRHGAGQIIAIVTQLNLGAEILIRLAREKLDASFVGQHDEHVIHAWWMDTTLEIGCTNQVLHAALLGISEVVGINLLAGWFGRLSGRRIGGRRIGRRWLGGGLA